MRNTVSAEIDVNVPVDVAYNQWTQFEELPEFMDGVEAVEQLDDEHLHWKIKVAGVRREFDATIQEQMPDDHIAWTSNDGNNAGLVSFESLDENRTRVNLRLNWEPHGFVEKVGGTVNLDDAQVRSDLERFKKIIESQGSATGAWRGTIGEPGSSTIH